MANMEDFRKYTSTPKRRNTFYCFCTTRYIQDQAIFFLLVETFRVDKSKRQALFINDWFINGNIPDEFTGNGYLSQVNIEAASKTSISKSTTSAVGAVGLNFADKMSKHGGGVSGFFGAVKQKLGNTAISEKLFDAAQGQVRSMLDDQGRHGFGDEGGARATYRPDGTYQPIGAFSNQVLGFRRALKVGGFDPDKLGIY